MSTHEAPSSSIASRIISKFGGIRPLARLLSKPPSTVQGWADAGLIPSKHQISIMEIAQREGVDLSPEDFFRPAEQGAAQ